MGRSAQTQVFGWRGAVLLLGLAAGACAQAAPSAGQGGNTTTMPPASAPPPASDALRPLRALAAGSQCAAHKWDLRGRAPVSYVEGVTLVFARAACHPERADVAVVSAAADAGPPNKDALAVYDGKFRALGLSNAAAGAATLRHSYALLLGLGMMESSGKYCEGRDVSQCFAAADSAEAGLFQTSWDARRASATLEPLFQRYQADPSGCLLDVFKGAITCRIRSSHNAACPAATSDVAGTGPGADWQRLTKSCPAFATEYAAVVLRRNGGPKGEFNPIRKLQAEVRPECDALLSQVQAYVAAHPQVCAAL